MRLRLPKRAERASDSHVVGHAKRRRQHPPPRLERTGHPAPRPSDSHTTGALTQRPPPLRPAPPLHNAQLGVEGGRGRSLGGRSWWATDAAPSPPPSRLRRTVTASHTLAPPDQPFPHRALQKQGHHLKTGRPIAPCPCLSRPLCASESSEQKSLKASERCIGIPYHFISRVRTARAISRSGSGLYWNSDRHASSLFSCTQSIDWW